MGFWRDFLLGPAPIIGPVTPFAPQDALTQITVKQLWPEHDTTQTLTRETALRVPAVKRAHDITCTVLAAMPWIQYDNEQPTAPQPEWLYNSSSGASPRDLRWGVVSDLFMYGWAAIGFQLDGNGLPADAMHVPFGWWEVDAGRVVVSHAEFPAAYTARVVAIPLGYGSSGMLTDARNSILAAIAIEAAYRDRVNNPTAHTNLVVSGDRWDGWLPEERAEFRDLYVLGRTSAKGAVSLMPDWIKADYPGTLPIDLFEAARNGARLDIANHAGIPGALLEGSKQGGGTDIKYSGVNNGAERNELWDFGLAKYADAIGGRLSLDDVCPSGQSIRVDASRYLTVPQPTTPQTSED